MSRKGRADLIILVGDLVHKKEVRWRPRGKAEWARDGDGNTNFFHHLANGRRKRNFIERLEVEGAGVIENEGDIETEILNFFKTLYSSNDEGG